MSQSGVERSDAGSNTEPRGEPIIDFDGDVRQTQPQTYEQPYSYFGELYDLLESNDRVNYAIYKAAYKGDWETAKGIYETHKLFFNIPITAERQTALHIAALAGQIQFATELIHKMRNDDVLWQEDSDGNTALVFAMVSGDMALVEAMLQNSKGFAISQSQEFWQKILALTSLGSKDIGTYIYGFRKDLIENDDRAYLLAALIDADMYDTACDLAKGKWFAACSGGPKVEVLHALAQKPHFLANTFPEAPSSIINRYWNLLTTGKAQRNNLSQSACELAENICDQVASDDEAMSKLGRVNFSSRDDRISWRPIFVAAMHGNVEFLKILIEKFPNAVLQRNEEGQTIFHVAVLFRRAEVFDLLSKIGSFKYLIAQCRDRKGNNLLHLAGQWPPSDYLDAVPGEALQFQRELLWFERVKKFVGPILAEAKNAYDLNPDGVFKNTHEILIKKAEEWMKKTADSCTIVAALVATVIFAAAFTTPGGNNQNTGFPMFLNEASFKTFIVSDAISLICALSSLLTFMSIQTSTYSLKDFVRSLPTKLLIGYSTLFVSIAAMMVTFVTVLFVYFRQHQLLIVALPLALVAVCPIGLFAILHYRLLAGMIMFWQALKNISH